jgi:hypothetical protein
MKSSSGCAQALPGGVGFAPNVARAAGAQSWESAFVKTSAVVLLVAGLWRDKSAG